MRQVSILKTSVELDTLEIRDRMVTAFIVNPDGIEHVAIEEESVPRTLKLLDPETGDPVTVESDPIRWAELLPTAYRSGDYRVVVDVVDEADMPTSATTGDTHEMPALLELSA